MSEDKTAKLWDGERGSEISLWHEGPVRGVAFSPDGRRVTTTSEDKTARLWDGKRGSEIATLRHQDPVWAAVFSPGGRRVVTSSEDQTAKLWDGERGSEIATLRHQGPVWAAVFSPDGRSVMTSSRDTTAKLWDLGFVTDHEGTELRDRACADRLTGANRIAATDALDPILREREGIDVCAPGPLSSSYWVSLARGLFDSTRESVIAIWQEASVRDAGRTN
jgi:WD40 repeat protein